MKIRILIVEDELIIAEDMREMLEELGYEVTAVTGEVDEAKRLLAATQPDIAMIDITLGVEQKGLDLAQHIMEKNEIPFIFCTSHADRGTIEKATKLHPHGYLVKPFEQKDLYSAIEVALANFSRKTTVSESTKEEEQSLIIRDALFIKEGNRYVKVKVEDIIWLTPDGNYTTLHVRENKKYLVRMPLKDFHEQLPQQEFFRTHRSYVVNIEFVEAVNTQSVFVGDEEIPLGKNYREELMGQLRKLS